MFSVLIIPISVISSNLKADIKLKTNIDIGQASWDRSIEENKCLPLFLKAKGRSVRITLRIDIFINLGVLKNCPSDFKLPKIIPLACRYLSEIEVTL